MTCKPSTSLPEPAADCSPTLSSATRQSEQLSLIPTAAESCVSAPPMDGSPVCACTKATFGCSIHPTTPAEWIACMQASLASLTASLASERAKLMSAICGPTPQGSLASYDPDSRCWKTCQASFLTDTPPLSSENFPRWGMTVGGRLFPLPMLELHTGEIGGGALQNVPTPMAADGDKHSPSPNGGNKGRNLVCMVNQYPTPSATDWKGSPSLERANQRQQESSRGVRLPEHISVIQQQEIGGKLSPVWVEWLMGWPLGWTGLKPSVTAKSRSRRRSPGESSEGRE